MAHVKRCAALCWLGLAALMVAGVPAQAARGKSKPKHWVGKPAGDLIAVMGAPERERQIREDRKELTWYRYPLLAGAPADEGVAAEGRYDPHSEYDPPPIPGDPTRQPARVIECSAIVGPGGTIVRVSMPKPCQVPPPGQAQEKTDKPELPRSAPADGGKPELPRSGDDGGGDKPPAGF